MVTKDDIEHQPLAFTRMCSILFHVHTHKPMPMHLFWLTCVYFDFMCLVGAGLKMVLCGRGQPFRPGSALGCACCTMTSTSDE